MKKILFVIPYPTGVAPSQRFRFEQYFEILKSQDIHFEVAPFWTMKGWNLLYQKNHTIQKSFALMQGFLRRLVLLFKTPRYDMVFIHREATPLGRPVFEYLMARVFKKKLIYDFDDAIWLPNTSEQNSIVGRLKYHQKVSSICKWSWKVSCGNDFLANYAKSFNEHVFVVPTTIETSYHKSQLKKMPGNPVTIGWTGTHSTTKYLKPLVPILRKLIGEFQVKILIISNQKPDWDFDDYEFVVWNKEKEIEQLDRIDIGIMPLDDTIWEEGKCGFKALQYMAMEKPTAVSSVGVNKRIISHEENGFLCATMDEWKTYLTSLILSESLRNKIGGKGRETIIKHYSVSSNTNRFLSLFE